MEKASKNVVGIDISKLKFDACLLAKGRAKPLFAMFANDRSGCEKFFAWLEHHQAIDAHVCMESTGIYSLAPATFLHSRNILVSVVNPYPVKAFGKSSMSRNKTDKADALLIARYCVEKTPRSWSPPSAMALRLRSLTSRYQDVQDDRIRILCRLETMFDEETRAFWGKRVKAMDADLKEIQDQLHGLCAAETELARQCKLLTSIPGIGEMTALMLLAELPDVRTFRNAKQLAAYAGLTPMHHSSGTSVNKRPRLSKMGNAAIRRMLYFPALCARRHNRPLRAFAERLKERGKAKMAVIGALMRKLMHCVYGVLTTGLPFDAAKVSGSYQIA